MTSFMSKKKKYKFQVEISLEEMLAVPFVSAVLFAKLRLLDGGSFQDHSSRQEVRDHMVHWGSNFSFPCKMMANASTGVMEKCILRISIRKECKGGRSFTKLGFVDLNLAEYAGAGVIHKRALLEGYDTRHRQDNSMLKFRIQLNMISGDILFKAPSPSLKHKQTLVDDATTDQRSDEFSSGSLAGSINSGSSGFGSLPKKRPPLMSSDLVIGQTLTEGSLTAPTPTDQSGNELVPPIVHCEQATDYAGPGHAQEPGHSRNSSNTSQMSRASGYSSISHSRQSSSGDSAAGHIRNAFQHQSLRRPSSKFQRTYTLPKHRIYIPNTILSESFGSRALDTSTPEVFHTPQGSMGGADDILTSPLSNQQPEVFLTPQCDKFSTPPKYTTQKSEPNGTLSDVEDVFGTPDESFSVKTDVFSRNFNALQKSASSSVVERIRNDLPGQGPVFVANTNNGGQKPSSWPPYCERKSDSGLRYSKSDFQIPKISPNPPRKERSISNILSSFLTPRLPRKGGANTQSTPISNGLSLFPPTNTLLSNQESRAVSMGNLKAGNDGLLLVPGPMDRLHRKMLLDGATVTKLAPMTSCSPPDDQPEENSVASLPNLQRRPSAGASLNPSSGSLATSSEGGSLERAKATFERRKKLINGQDDGAGTVSCRVENTRVNPVDFIDELLKTTNLEQHDGSAETSRLQLFIAKDGTAAVGSQDVKSQMSTGMNMFQQVVMDDR